MGRMLTQAVGGECATRLSWGLGGGGGSYHLNPQNIPPNEPLNHDHI